RRWPAVRACGLAARKAGPGHRASIVQAVSRSDDHRVERERGGAAGRRKLRGILMGQYLTFKLWREEYAIEILRVQEIRGHSRITPIPNTPAYVKGVINLRCTVVPVVDLRCRLGMPDASDMRFSAIVVVPVGATIVGLFVDEVSDVAD